MKTLIKMAPYLIIWAICAGWSMYGVTVRQYKVYMKEWVVGYSIACHCRSKILMERMTSIAGGDGSGVTHEK